jgi:hypothetical protein
MLMHQMRISTNHVHAEKVGNPKIVKTVKEPKKTPKTVP